MQVWTLPIIVLMLALTVSGCGQKGPLYRDSQGPSVTPEADASRDQQAREENRD